MNIVYSQELSKNVLLNTLTYSGDIATYGAIDTWHYDNYKISVVSSKPIIINLKFHNQNLKTAVITDTKTLVANTYEYNVKMIKGERCFLEIDKNGATLAATDFLYLNVWLCKSQSNLIL